MSIGTGSHLSRRALLFPYSQLFEHLVEPYRRSLARLCHSRGTLLGGAEPVIYVWSRLVLARVYSES